jgi:hypothetical protein
VSPLWRDEVSIALSPRRVALSRRARGLVPRVVAATELAVPGPASAETGPALAALGEALSDRAWHGADARVLVDPPWTCLAVLPWPPARLDAAGRLAHARFVLGDAFGDGVEEWSVALAETPPGRTLVACAMPATLRGDLEERLAPARLRLVSLQPALVAAFNGWRRRLTADDGWFVALDEATLSAARVRRGEWERVYSARVSADWSLELERLQAFARVVQPGGVPRLWVDGPDWMRRSWVPSEGIEWLRDAEGTPGTALVPAKGVPA